MLTRRLFVVGLGATVAAASATAWAHRDLIFEGEAVTPVPSPVAWRSRKVFYLMISPKCSMEGAASVSLERSNGLVLFQQMIHRSSFLRWVARPGDELRFLADDPLRILVDGSTEDAVEQITLIGTDTMPDGEEVRFCEAHRWPGPSVSYARLDMMPAAEDGEEEMTPEEEARIDALLDDLEVQESAPPSSRWPLFGRKLW